LAEAGANAHVEELNTRQDGDALLDALNKSVTGWESVPQVFIKGKFIGTNLLDVKSSAIVIKLSA
jgi:glutaredoxin-related protein